MTDYRGEQVVNTRVDRINESLDTEQLGAGGVGKARANFDGGQAGPTVRVKGATTQLNTDGFSESTDAAIKRLLASA